MQHKRIEQLKTELKNLVYILIALIIVIQAVYYKENFTNAIKMALGIYWLFVIPGYTVMLYWIDELEFLERLIFGTIAGLGLLGSISYILGLYTVQVKIHWIIIPLALIVIGGYFGIKHEKN